MDLTTAQNAFAVRLYEWSQRDFFRELEEGCPLISQIGLNDRSMAAFVKWNETLSSKQRKALVIACTRHCHENAVRLKGEVMTEHDKEWYKARYENITAFREHVPALETADKTKPNFKPADPDRCLAALAENLSPCMGRPSCSKSKVRCTRKLEEWKIVTEFTFLRRNQSLSFEYQFIRKDGFPIKGHTAQGIFPRTLLFFYGLSHTMVRVVSQSDCEPMAKVMAKLAEYFVAQADPLFSGLGMND